MSEEPKSAQAPVVEQSTSSPSLSQELPQHTLRSVNDLLSTPTEGEDLRKSFFLPLELLEESE